MLRDYSTFLKGSGTNPKKSAQDSGQVTATSIMPESGQENALLAGKIQLVNVTIGWEAPQWALLIKELALSRPGWPPFRRKSAQRWWLVLICSFTERGDGLWLMFRGSYPTGLVLYKADRFLHDLMEWLWGFRAAFLPRNWGWDWKGPPRMFEKRV